MEGQDGLESISDMDDMILSFQRAASEGRVKRGHLPFLSFDDIPRSFEPRESFINRLTPALDGTEIDFAMRDFGTIAHLHYVCELKHLRQLIGHGVDVCVYLIERPAYLSRDHTHDAYLEVEPDVMTAMSNEVAGDMRDFKRRLGKAQDWWEEMHIKAKLLLESVEQSIEKTVWRNYGIQSSREETCQICQQELAEVFYREELVVVNGERTHRRILGLMDMMNWSFNTDLAPILRSLIETDGPGL